MQGLTTTVNGTEQISATTTLQGPSNEWTCKRWFNNIATKVSAKTHRYFGWFVAAVAAPVTFIPSLACDLYHSAKSLYQRNVNKIESPMELRVPSIGREQPVTSEEPTTFRSNSPEPIMRSELSEAPPEYPPSVSFMRKAFPNLNTHLTDLEDAFKFARQNLTDAINRNAQLKDDVKQTMDQLSAEIEHLKVLIKAREDRILNLEHELETANARAGLQLVEIAKANKTISEKDNEIEVLRSLIREQDENKRWSSPTGSDTGQQSLSAEFETILTGSNLNNCDTSGKEDEDSVEILGYNVSPFPSPHSSFTPKVTDTHPATPPTTPDGDFEVVLHHPEGQHPEGQEAPTVDTTSKSTDDDSTTRGNND